MIFIWLFFLTVTFSFAEDKGFEVSVRCEEVDAKIKDLDNKYRRKKIILLKY